MNSGRPTLLERAFELAASGDFSTITQLKAALRQQGYEAVEPQLAGKTVRAQLRRLIRETTPVETSSPEATEA